MKRCLAVFLMLCAGLPAQTKKILYLNGDPASVRDLASVSPKVRIVPVERGAVMREIGDADAFIGEIRPEEVRAGKNLKWVQSYSAGVERFLELSGSDALKNSSIVLTNNRIVQGPEIADHAFAMLLLLTRRLEPFLKDRQAIPGRGDYHSIELNGRTALVVGLGGIGTQIAIRAWAFGMEVIAVDPEDKPITPYVKRIVRPEQLNEVLPQADVVFISAPHTPASRKMIGARQFDIMKQDAYFIAVSRGALYDTNGLVKALDSRRLSGAGLDVTDPEPLPSDHALRKFGNVIVTPHIAGQSDKSNTRMRGTVKENVRRFADGEPLINVVDKQKGY
jgi:phosphoglycerate dehydrogenase-like enzyme